MVINLFACSFFLSTFLTISYGQSVNFTASNLTLHDLINWDAINLPDYNLTKQMIENWFSSVNFTLDGYAKFPGGELIGDTVKVQGSIPPPENREFAKEQYYLRFMTRPDSDLAHTCGQFIKSRGFGYKRYYVTTEDDYTLTLYRIYNKYAWKALGKKLKPVILAHGAFVSCASWMYNMPDGQRVKWIDNVPPEIVPSNNLAFVLANLEFDVWVVNSRGTSYSRKHSYLDADTDPEYWDYSWEDMADYDVPAIVNFVIKKSCHEKVTYIGYSQGNVEMFAHLSDNPEFADKLALNIAIAPLTFFGNPGGLLGLFPRGPEFYRPLENLKGPLPPNLPEFNAMLAVFCANPIFNIICLAVYSGFLGLDVDQLNPPRFPIYASLFDTVSVKQLLHYDQAIFYDAIRRYDYTEKENLAFYGSPIPPQFDIENIPTYNLVLISGINDLIATQVNVQKLRNTLRSKALVDYFITHPDWNHGDPIVGNQAFPNLNLQIVQILRKYLSTM